MKTRVAALTLCVCMLLSGCSSMLERDYLSVSRHTSVSSDGGGAESALRVENYQDLVNAVLYLVSEGVEHGVIGLYNYTRDVEADLTAACLEVVQEDPLGAYAVEYIRHDHTLIVSYHEANIYITYRRTPEQVAGIASVTGSSAIRQEVQRTLAEFESESVLRVSYFFEDEESIRSLVRQAYYDTPVAAMGMPEIDVTLYPEGGLQRIVEIEVSWGEPKEALQKKSLAVRDAAAALLSGQSADAQTLFSVLRSSVRPAEEGNTSYHALAEGEADSEGLALAYQLLCDQAGVPCTVVEGELGGRPWFWNIADSGENAVHVDCWSGLYGLSDSGLIAEGSYAWDAAEYPACGTETEGKEDEIRG